MLIHTLSQTKTHLIHFKSNENKPITKVDVFKLHMMVSKVTIFDKIRENPYSRKSPYSH